ncbi:MAG: class I SAM-dependent methyltransferase [Gemmatimonadota bacterium]
MNETASSADVERVYDRVAALYDLVNAPMEWLGGDRRRRRLLARARGDVLEVGIGTGRNLPHYPEGVRITGIDLSKRMLERARERTRTVGREVDLVHADVERLPFDDDRFDTVTAACVFCSVADALQGLREVRRVVKPTGRVLLLEHVRPRNPVLGKVFDVLSPLTRRVVGPEINRRTEQTVRAADLEIEDVRREGIWREIVARKAARRRDQPPRRRSSSMRSKESRSISPRA